MNNKLKAPPKIDSDSMFLSKTSIKLKILMIEDSEDDALLILHELKKCNFEPIYERVDTLESLEKALKKKWDIITADYSIPNFNGLLALNVLQKKNLDIPFIIVSGKIGEELAVESMKNGACDYVPKKHLSRLIPTITREVDQAEVRQQLKQEEQLNIALNEINRAIMATLDFNKVMVKVVEQSALAMEVDSCAIALPESEGWAIKARFPEELTNQFFSTEEAPLLEAVMRSNNQLVINDATVDERISEKLRNQYKLGALLAMPLFVNKELIGVLVFSSHSEPVIWSNVQIDFSKKLSVSIALAIKNSSLYKQQCNIATTLQQAALNLPEKIPGLEYSHFYHSATQTALVGGDFYDIFEIQPNKIAVLIGDVSGKGIEAATLASVVNNTVKAYAHENYETADIMDKTNVVLLKSTADAEFVTMFFATLDLSTGFLHYSRAGHPPPIIKRKNGDIVLLEEGSTPLGVISDERHLVREAVVGLGDTLLLYTDGLVETRDGSELFGEERLIDLVTRLKVQVRDLPGIIFKSTMTFAGGALSDDVALLAISRLKGVN